MNDVQVAVLAKARIGDGCWEWTMSTKNGYGQVNIGGKIEYAHRVVSGARKGDTVCHTCDNKACVRPSHLYLGTPSANARDRLRRHRGHKLTLEVANQIRDDFRPRKEIAEAYGITPAMVGYIQRKVSWFNV
jgi:HNH endonuclease